MNWIEASLILFGGLTVAMGVGVPVAIQFMALFTQLLTLLC